MKYEKKLGLTILSCCLIVSLCTQVHAKDQCVFRGSCDTFTSPTVLLPLNIPCVYNGPAQRVDDISRLTQLNEICPFLKPLENPLLCCDESQIDSLVSQMALPRGMFSRCPSCFYNFANIMCQMACSPRQSEFIKVTLKEPSKEVKGKDQLVQIKYAIKENVAETFYNSCVNVLAPGPGSKPIEMMCPGGDQCTPHQILSYIGRKDPAPYNIDWQYFPGSSEPGIQPIDSSYYQCFESPQVFNKSACSCSDCPAVCKPLPKPEPRSPFTIFGLDGMVVTMTIVFIVTTAIVVIYFSKYTRQNQLEEAKLQSLRTVATSSIVLTNPSDNQEALATAVPDSANVVETIGTKLEQFLETAFSKWSRIVTHSPVIVITVGFILALLCAIPLLFHLEITTDPVELWSSPKSVARQEKSYFDTHFGPFYRNSQLIIKKTTQDSIFNYTNSQGEEYQFNSIFDKDFLLEILELQTEITSLTANYNNETVALEDICYEPLNNGKCVIQSPLGWFQNNASRLEDDPSSNYTYLDHIISCLGNPYSLDDSLKPFHYPCLGEYGGPALPKIALGGFDRKYAQNSSARAYAMASSIIISIVINNHVLPEENKKAQAWEKVFLDYMKNLNTSRFSNIDVAHYSERSVQDEINRQSSSDLSTVITSYLVMFAYVSFTLGQFSTKERFFVDSKVGLGLAGVVIVLASVNIAIGLMVLMGFKLTLIILEVAPFLALAVGVDNIFILVRHLQRDVKASNESSHDRMARVLGKCGPSLLMATACEVTCFFLGALSSMPAIRVFAINAGLALLADFLLQISVFVAVLYLDMERQRTSRLDLLCCFRLDKNEANIEAEGQLSEPGLLHRIFRDSYAPNLMKDGFRASVIIIFVLWLCSSITVLNKVDVGIDQELSMPHDSYVLKYFKAQKKYLNVGPPVYFVVGGNYDYSNRDHQTVICGGSSCGANSLFSLITQASKDPEETYIVDSPTSWLDDYFDWASSSSCCREFKNATKDFCPSTLVDVNRNKACKHCDIEDDNSNIKPEKFYNYLKDYLDDVPTPLCPKGGRGAYHNAVKLDENNTISASYFSSYHSPLTNSKDFIEAMRSARYLADNIKRVIQSAAKPGEDVQVFPYSLPYVFYEQYLTIYQDTVISLAISLLAIFVVSFILYGFDIRSALLVVTTIACIVVNVIGCMYWWDIALNAISLVNLVMAAGISVEFCSHITHAYATSSQATRKQRAREALASMGSSVLSGITLTKFAGILVLAWASSQIFVVFYFRMYLCIVLVGALHGLVFLPVLLSILGGKPKLSIHSNQEHNSPNHHHNIIE